MFEFRGHKEARKFCQANPINDIQTGEGRERERERLFIVARYEDAFYAFPKMPAEEERGERKGSENLKEDRRPRKMRVQQRMGGKETRNSMGRGAYRRLGGRG